MTKSKIFYFCNANLFSLGIVCVFFTVLDTGCLVSVDPEKSKNSKEDSSGEEDTTKASKESQTDTSTYLTSKSSTSDKSSGADKSEQESQADSENPNFDPDGKCKDGSDRVCFETPGGEVIDFPGSVPKGSCKFGKQVCMNGEWGSCIGAIGPKERDTCDEGNDDNCNGTPNDHCDCNPGHTQKCGTNQGVCKKGVVSCGDDGKWETECVGEVKPSVEICDGLADENCDGKSDKENCECIKGDTKKCGIWTLGACKQGDYYCTDKGTWDTSQCIGEIKPSTEICDGKADENCDGKSDAENCQCILGKTQECGNWNLGVCRKGKFHCTTGGVWDTSQCVGEIRPGIEKCDGEGLDEDCDGLADVQDPDCNCVDGRTEDCGESNKGICRYGKRTCRNGQWGNCIGEIKPNPFEICDGVNDDNCNNISDQVECECINGETDDCTIGGARGDCALGKKTCMSGQWSGCNRRFDPIPEVCGLRTNPEPSLASPTGDEDCDGISDESDSGNNYQPKGSSKFMRDLDGDGWGARGNGSNTIKYFCDIEQASREKFIRYNMYKHDDCGDCEGSDGRSVHPGSLGRDVPSKCLDTERWSGGDFDYDCDGTEELESPETEVSCRFRGGQCVGTSGWSELPECGEQKYWYVVDTCVKRNGGTPSSWDKVDSECEFAYTYTQKKMKCN